MRRSSIAPLIDIARRGTPFTSYDGRAFVRRAVPGGGFICLPVRSRAFREWFYYQVFAEQDFVPSTYAFSSICRLLEAEASQGEHQNYFVFRRVGARGPSHAPRQLLIDLADSDGRFVEISPGAWRVTSGEDANFETSLPTKSLPEPVANPAGSPSPLDILRSCLNLPSHDDWLRCLAWLIASYRSYGLCPILILQGPPGSGKSCLARVLRFLVDPSISPLTPTPSSVRELITLARNNWVLAFDHISKLSPQIAETLCKLSSGVGVSVSEGQHSAGVQHSEAAQQYFRRPVILTVTGQWTCPADLEARAITVTLPAIEPENRRTEMDIFRVLAEAWPGIFGALCTALSAALGELSSKPPSGPAGSKALSPQFADAYAWAVAAAPALGCTAEEMRHALAGGAGDSPAQCDASVQEPSRDDSQIPGPPTQENPAPPSRQPARGSRALPPSIPRVVAALTLLATSLALSTVRVSAFPSPHSAVNSVCRRPIGPTSPPLVAHDPTSNDRCPISTAPAPFGALAPRLSPHRGYPENSAPSPHSPSRSPPLRFRDPAVSATAK